MSLSKTLTPYTLLPSQPGLALGLQIAAPVTAASATSHGSSSPDCHPTPGGVYRARDLVALAAPLLDTVIVRLGADRPGDEPAGQVLIDGLAASLAVRGRESVLPLLAERGGGVDAGSARATIARQAQAIAHRLVGYAREFSRPRANGRPDLALYSACEGHVWTPAVAALLLGPRSDAGLMALYNEWLHRSILLRDALLPFDNYDDVPLVVPAGGGGGGGVRAVEEQRRRFLLETLTGRAMRNSALVDLAKVFTAPQLPRDAGYGFQYAHGLVLPAFLSASASASPVLLRYHAARIDDSVDDVLFDYEEPVYERAPRSDLSAASALRAELTVPGPASASWSTSPSVRDADARVVSSSIGVISPNGSGGNTRVLKLELVLHPHQSISVDLGQITRGYRYAYGAAQGKEMPPSSTSSIHLHDTSAVLALPGLVSSSGGNADAAVAAAAAGGVHAFPASNPLVRWALLGRLYPGNIVLVDEGQKLEDVLHVGKGFGSKFLILASKEEN